ncbi:MAG: DedA family protein [Candidatus Marsarchaeota archaeon]|jgi:membrane protein DedA with SNARE-associated domain|nr:DedA family protein [Candidatus Marsarchaeota archaeon]
MYFILSILTDLLGLVSGSYAIVVHLMQHYGYLAIFGMMALEGSSVPIPSEIVLPLTGALAQQHVINLYIGFIAALAGSITGLAVDYYIGYYLGKDVVYKHLNRFNIKKESLDAFDAWFERNGIAAVLFSRLVPVIRTVMSFPAGFAKMPKKEFFGYSILGSLVYDAVLVSFGYYLLSAKSAVVIMTGIGVFAIILYLVYRLFMSKVVKTGSTKQ